MRLQLVEDFDSQAFGLNIPALALVVIGWEGCIGFEGGGGTEEGLGLGSKIGCVGDAWGKLVGDATGVGDKGDAAGIRVRTGVEAGDRC